jgi:proline iminopeptidase
MRLVLAVVATVAGAALAGAAATVAVAAATTSPALFLGAGTVAALAVWFAAAHLIGRGRGPGLRWGVRVAGALTVAAGLAAVLVPLGDPVRPPAAPPGASAWTLPDGDRLAHGVVRAAPGTTPATPVVVLHGGPGVPDLAGHLAALAPLAADGHDVWAYAQRGTGGSSRLADPSGYTTGLAVDDLEQVRRRIGAGRMILLGHSYGSFLAAAYTAAHPERVERLVFSSPGDLRQGGIGGRPQSRLDAGRTLRLYGLLAPPRAMLAYEVPQSVNRPAVPEPAGQLAGSPTPALVIKGECDYLGWGSATAYLDAFPDSTLSYVPGAGHDAYLDEPERWVAAVRGFLDGSPVPGALPDPHRAPDGYGRR